MDRASETRELEALDIPHPSPYRDRFPIYVLLLPLFVPPVLWAVQLSVRYALIATACFPHHAPVTAPTAHGGISWIVAVAVALSSLLVMLGLGLLSLRIWRKGGSESGHPRRLLLDIGEGRTSFLAHWGIYVSFGFLVVTIFDSLPLIGVPLCGS
jgi:hypothetical protein